MRTSGLTLTCGALLVAAKLGAQVGHEPDKSPYRDIEQRQEITFFSGHYSARKDPVQVAPQSGPLMGIHYQWRAAGPANITLEMARVGSHRRVLDPLRDGTCASGVDCKLIATYRWPVYFFDAGLALDLTGPRTFYGFVPEIAVGAGMASDFHTQEDVGEFGFGTRFALKYGAGIRWLPGGGWPLQLRANFTNYLYSIKYPESYYAPAPDNSVILPPTQARTVWLNNMGLTLGLSYLYSR